MGELKLASIGHFCQSKYVIPRAGGDSVFNEGNKWFIKKLDSRLRGNDELIKAPYQSVIFARREKMLFELIKALYSQSCVKPSFPQMQTLPISNAG